MSKCSCWPRWRERSREETRSQGQTVVRDRLSPQQSPTILSNKQSIQEVTHESPPHNSHVATLKLRGPPIFPWKVYKHYISKKLKRTMSKVNGFFVYQLINIIFLKTPLKTQTAALTECLGGDFLPCWLRLYRWSSASGTVDWCCDWLKNNMRRSHQLEKVGTPQWTETLRVDSIAHMRTADLASAKTFRLGLQGNNGSLKDPSLNFLI